MPIKLPSINLNRLNQKNFVDKFIDWAMTFGRVAVILTEIIALSAFLYRFTLDRQLVDLHDKIVQKETYVKLLKSNEDKYRNLQDRLSAIAHLDSDAKRKIALLSTIYSLAQGSFSITDIRMADQSLHVNARAASINDVSQFINQVKKQPDIDSVSVDKIENKTTSAIIIVGITVSIKKQQARI